MASAVSTPTTPKTTTSVDPLYTQAVNQAKAALGAEITPIQQAQAASDAQYTAQEKDAGDAATAASGLLSSIGPAVLGDYTTAAQNQELAGAGFSQGMQDALKGNTDNLNAMLAKLGSPQVIADKSQEAGDVLYGLGGFTPGVTFAKQGAAAAAAADQLPGDAILQGQETVKGLQSKALAADADFANKIAAVAAKLPGDVQTNYEKLQTIALNNKKFALDVQKANTDAKFKAIAANLAASKYKTSVDEFNARQALAVQKMNVQANQFAQRMSATWARIGLSQKTLQYKIAQNAFKVAHGGLTQAEVSRYNQKLDALVASSGGITRPVNGVMPTPQYQDKSGKWHPITDTTVVPKGARTTGQNTYSNFITAALKKGVPIQLAITRANTLYPPTQRQLDPSLEQLPAIAAQAAKQSAAYNQMVGVTLGTSPKNGQSIAISVPKNLTAKGKQAVGGILNLASEYLGTPYAWGGESPTGFDCSGLAQYIYAKEGINIPRTTYTQFQSGLSVPKNELQPGDLVFFKGSDSVNGLPGHVGIYVGNGLMVDAPHTGAVVRVESVDGFGGYMGARRYVH